MIPMTLIDLFSVLKEMGPKTAFAAAAERIKFLEGPDIDKERENGVLAFDKGVNEYDDLWFERERADEILTFLAAVKHRTPGDDLLVMNLEGWKNDVEEEMTRVRQHRGTTVLSLVRAVRDITEEGADALRDYFKDSGLDDHAPLTKEVVDQMEENFWEDVVRSRLNEPYIVFAYYLAVNAAHHITD